MKAIQANLLNFLYASPQFVIPIYQRNYSWTAAQCQQLWNDLLRAGRNSTLHAHFIGSIVYVENGLLNVTRREPLLVIDGQQRLTTCTLLIAALASHFEKNKLAELFDSFSTQKLQNYYLFNPQESGERRFKLLLSETDKDTLLAILQSQSQSHPMPMPDASSARIVENHAMFQKLIEDHKDELPAICQGLAKLVIVDVSLDRSQDNPQLIFESMNSTGLELSQADLIRNFILMGLEPALQTELYKTYWRPMEKGFGQYAYATHFDAFMRDYLIAKTGEIPNVREVYVAFKAYAHSLPSDIRALVADVHAYATYYCAVALDAEKEPTLRQAFHDLRELKVDVAYPFLLDAYRDYRHQHLSVDELRQIVRLVESYVFRRAICAIPTNSMNKTFASLSRSLKKDRYLESVQAAFLLLPSYRSFPRDAEFQRKLKERDLYKFRSRSYWLRRLENHGRKERVMVEDYTIEHILPQNDNLSPEWQAELGPEWQRIQQTWLHTLGNLTLTAYNSEYSDRPFTAKKNAVSTADGSAIGFASSPLRLNQFSFQLDGKTYSLCDAPAWTEAAIQARAECLAQEAVKVWQAPQLADDVLEAYKPKVAKAGQLYSLDDHPQLAATNLREVFMALRQAVLALDPCVKEEVLKLYIAYKAETNFVDVVPQAKRLRLSLNMPFHAIDDPKGMCRDVTHLGQWGNGCVEVHLSTREELPYVMGLIRQSFERQMDDTPDA